jgi:hypothetical protein
VRQCLILASVESSHESKVMVGESYHSPLFIATFKNTGALYSHISQIQPIEEGGRAFIRKSKRILL